LLKEIAPPSPVSKG